jgi:hypothetical protein
MKESGVTGSKLLEHGVYRTLKFLVAPAPNDFGLVVGAELRRVYGFPA